jgi:tripartite-type tricarboxylate transporter receptor subunit TctC
MALSRPRRWAAVHRREQGQAARGRRRQALEPIPDLPTLVEAGLVKHMVAMWFGLLAPAGTPAPIVAKLNEAVAKPRAIPIWSAHDRNRDVDPRQRAGRDADLMASESTNVESMIQRLGLRAQ